MKTTGPTSVHPGIILAVVILIGVLGVILMNRLYP